jgi:uncharacterized membrane protein YtjA (UPF0391 family)
MAIQFDLLTAAFVCLAVAVIAWIFGYSRYATGTASLAKFLFLLFSMLFVTLLILTLIGVEPERPPV